MPGTVPKLDAFFRTPKIRNKFKNALNRANRALRVFIKDFGEDHDKFGTTILSPSSSVQPEPPTPAFVDMPLNDAVYVSGRNKIYACRGGYIFQFDANGELENSARVICPEMDDTNLSYDNTTDNIWMVMRRSFGAPSDSSFPIKWLLKINPDTLAITTYSFRAGAGGDGVVKFGDNWFGGMMGPQKIKCKDGIAFMLFYGNTAQDEIEGFLIIDLTTNPPEEIIGDTGDIGAAGGWGDLSIESTNVWGCATDDSNGVFGIDTTTYNSLTDFVQLDGLNDRPYGIARVPAGAMYITQATNIILKGTPAAAPVLRTTIDLGRPNATPFQIKYNSVDGLIYIPCYKDNTVIKLNPADDSFVVKFGFDSPWDVVFTNAKAFAVQHGSEGLKEIV